jgi:hypothetical protein
LLRRGPPENCPCGFHRRQLKQAQGRSGTCRFLSVPRSPARAAVKIRCRSRRTLLSGERQSMASHTKTSFAGPFTVRCPTCPPIPTELTSIRFTAHLPTSAPLSGPGHHGSVSGQLPSNGHLEEQPHRCGFLSAFAHRHSLLGHPVPARGFRHSLRLAYRTATAAQTLSGFPRSAHVRNDRGGCLLYSGAAVSSRPPRPP